MNDPMMPINHGAIMNNYNYKKNYIPNNLRIEDVNSNDNIINYNSLKINDDQNNNNIDIDNNNNIISSTHEIIGQNKYIKAQRPLNNYQKIIQDLQYINAFLNKKNLDLENELEHLKNKYNSTKNDLNDINKHISICKENQDKIIKDLDERNNYLENLLMKNENNINKDELLDNKKNINLNLFIYKMKKIFKNNMEVNENIKDEEYLNIISDNISKINDELIKYKKDIEKKDAEIKQLKNENQVLKLKLSQNNYNNKHQIIASNDPSSNYCDPSIDYITEKPSMTRRKLLHIANDNISNFDYKDNYSNYSNSQVKVPIYPMKYSSYSPSPLRSNFINNLPKTPTVGNVNNKTYDIDYKASYKRNGLMRNMERKLMNSHSIASLKFKTLNEYENNKRHNMNKYQLPKATLVNQQCINSKNSLQSLMNNVTQLENALKNAQKNIDANCIDNINCLS